MPVALYTVTNEGSHGNTTVLDLSMTKETNGGLVTDAPEVGIGQSKGVVVAND